MGATRCFKISLLQEQSDIEYVKSLQEKYPKKDIETCIGTWQELNDTDELPSENQLKQYFIDSTIDPSDGQIKAFEKMKSNAVVSVSKESLPKAFASSKEKTNTHGVVIDTNLKTNYQEWQRNNPNGIVAYRVNFAKYNTPEEATNGRIGNPFSENLRGANTVEQFMNWLINGNNYGNDKATEEYRQAIIQKLLSIEHPNILYYTQLNRPSHATVLGYLIEHKDLIGGTSNSLSGLTLHSGAAYGADTEWDLIGREFGMINTKHYRDKNNAKVSKRLEQQGVQATILSDEQLEYARKQVNSLLGMNLPDTIAGRLKARNYYQVANSDSVFAIGLINDKMNGVHGGTDVAVQLGRVMHKPTYVFDLRTDKWFTFNNGILVETETPTLTQNFAGVGTRDIEDYVTKDTKSGEFVKRSSLGKYVGDEKRDKARDAIRQVYEKTLANGIASNNDLQNVASFPTDKPSAITSPQKLAVAVHNAQVIWAHPSMGKTYMKKDLNRDDIIDFDSEYKYRMGKSAERQKLQKENFDEYANQIYTLFDEAVEEAKRTDKKLLVSDMIFLDELSDELDLVINMSNEAFANRSVARGSNDVADVMKWKERINKAMVAVSPEQYFVYDGNLSDILPYSVPIPSNESLTVDTSPVTFTDPVDLKSLDTKMSAREKSDCVRRISFIYSSIITEFQKKLPSDMSTGSWAQDRRMIMQKYKGDICDMMRNRITTMYVLDSNVRAYLDDSFNFASDDIREACVTERKRIGNLMLDNFRELFELSKEFIVSYEPIKQVYDTEGMADEDDFSKFEEGYFDEIHESSADSMVDAELRFVLSNIYNLSEDGSPLEVDAIGDYIPMDFSVVSSTLRNITSNVLSDEDMIPALMDNVKRHPWMKQVLDVLLGKETTGFGYAQAESMYSGLSSEQIERKTLSLQSRFWKDYHKYNVRMATQSMAGGTITCSIENRTEGADANFERYKQACYNGTPMTDDNGRRTIMLYDILGNLNQEAYERLVDIYKNYDIDAKLSAKDITVDTLSDTDIEVIRRILLSLGVNHDNALIKDVVMDSESNDRYFLSKALREIFKYSSLFDHAISNKNDNIFDSLRSQYEALAVAFARQSDSVEESSVFVNMDGERKRLYSHIYPNHIHTIFGWLTNKDKKNEDAYVKRLYDKFVNNWWFHNGGKMVRHAWLRDCINKSTSKAARRGYGQIKSLLATDTKGYSTMTEYMSMASRLNEYFFPDISMRENFGDMLFRYYAAPTMSDKNAFYFISGRKYNSANDVVAAYVEVVKQEIERINMVRLRYKEIYENHNEDIKPIDYWDITVDSNGNIKSYGGSKFFFIKGLNDTPMLDEISANLADLDNIIKKYVRQELDKEFFQFVKFFNRTGSTYINDSPYNVMNDFGKMANSGRSESIPNSARRYVSEALDLIIMAMQKDESGEVVLQANTDTINAAIRFKEAVDKSVFLPDQYDYVNNWIDWTIDSLQRILNAENLSSNNLFLKRVQNALSQLNNNSNILDSNKAYLKQLYDFFYNDHFARTEIIQLTVIDPAFFGSNDNFQKRYAQVYTPYSPCYTSHQMYDENNNVVSVDKYTSKHDHYIILADEVLSNGARSIDNIKSALKMMKERGLVFEDVVNNIVNSQCDITISDAQCYRSPSSWLKILNMTGRADDSKARKFIEDLKTGDASKYDLADFYSLIEVIKPFVSAIIEADSHVSLGRANNSENDSKILVPTQHKDSEFMITAMYSVLNSMINDSPKLKAIGRFLEDHGIDKVLFVSAVKDGSQGAIDINDLEDEDEIYAALESVTGLTTNENGQKMQASDAFLSDDNGNFLYGTEYGNRDVVHRNDMSNWGICTPMPEHLLSVAKSSISTQAMKIIQEDIPDGETINLNGRQLDKNDWLKIYQAMFTQRVFRAFKEVYSTIKNTRKLVEFLREQITSNGKYPQDLLYYLELDDAGNFKHPILDPLLNNEFDAMVSSLTRNRIAKQQILNAALVQVSSYGMENQLSLRFNDEDGNLILDESDFDKASEEQRMGYDKFEDYKKNYSSRYSKSIAYMEIAIPIPRKEIMDALVDKNGRYISDICDKKGRLDYDKLKDYMNERLMNGVGIRIPVEAKHSMCPVRIKFFLPTNNASCVMVPPEWIAMSDSDHDADKLYTMLYEVDHCYTFPDDFGRKLRRMYNNNYETVPFKEFIKIIKKGDRSATPKGENWEEYFQFAEKVRTLKIEPVSFKMEDMAPEQGESESSAYARSIINAIPNNNINALNNLYIDLVRSVLNTDFNTAHMLTPGGFPEVRRVTAIMKALGSVQDSEHLLNSDNRQNVIALINAKTEKDIAKLGFKTDTESYSISNPAMGVIYHVRNMMGKKLVALFANLRTFRAAVELSNLGISKDDFIVINHNNNIVDWNSDSSTIFMSHQRNGSGHYVSDTLAEFSGGAVDNAKKATMAYLGLNLTSSPWAGTLAYFGYSILEISAFLRQPVIADILNKMNNEGVGLQTAIKQKKEELSKKMFNTYGDMSSIKNLDIVDMLINIANPNTEDWTFVKSQLAVLDCLSKLVKWSERINDLNKACRGHTQNGSAKADAYANASLVSQIKSITTPTKQIFLNEENLITPIPSEDPISKLDLVNKSHLPMETAFRYFVIECMENLHNGISMAYNPIVNSVCDELQQISGYKSLPIPERKAVTEAAISYFLSNINAFANGNMRIFRNNTYLALPDILKTIRRTRPTAENNIGHLLENDLINDLFINMKGTKYSRYKPFMNISKVSRGKIGAQKYRTAWEELFNYGDMKFKIMYNNEPFECSYQELANYLLAYCFFVNGMAMTYNDFIQAFPRNKIDSIPGYVNMVKSMRFANDSRHIKNIKEQYIANNPLSVASHKINVYQFRAAILSDESKILPDIIEINSKQEDNSLGKNAAKLLVRKTDKGMFAYDYITIVENVNSVVALYKGHYEGGKAIYERMNLLGNGNFLQEYEYGRDMNMSDRNAVRSVLNIHDTRISTYLNFGAAQIKEDTNVDASALKNLGETLLGIGGSINVFDNPVYKPSEDTLTGVKYCKKL